MRLTSWLSAFSNSVTRYNARADRMIRRRRVLKDVLERLEDRLLLSTFYVDNTPTIAGAGLDQFTPVGGTLGVVTGLTQGVNLFTTIGAAISAAELNGLNNGDVILVANGTYSEGMTVNEDLTIRGNQFGVDARSGRPAANESIISNAGGSFGVHANNVTIDGFVLQGQTTVNTAVGFGYNIYLAPGTTGAHIQNNVIQNNIVGVALANSGASQTTIQRNLFQNNTNPGSASGHDIYADNYTAGVGGLNNVLIDNNKFTNSVMVVDRWAVGLSNVNATPFTNITISNNEVVNHGRGFYFYSVDGATVSGNTITGVTNYGVGVFDANVANSQSSNITISGNTITTTGTGVPVSVDENGYSGTLTVSSSGIVNVSGTAGNDTATIKMVAGVLQFSSGGTTINLTNPAGFNFDGDAGDDTLTVDYTGGFFAVPITFTGGESAGDNDVLTVIGNGAQTAVYTPSAATNGNGTVNINNGTLITFTQLEPINVTGMATFVLSLPAADDNVTITETTAMGNPALALSGTSAAVPFELANVWNNTNVVINTTLGGDGNDTITVASAANAHANTNLSIITGTGADAININGNISVTGTLLLSTSDAVTQTGSITAAGLALLGSGSYVLTNPANDVGTLAGNTNAISYRDSDDLAIGTLTTTTNVATTTNTQGILTSNDNVLLQTGSTLLIDDDISIGSGVFTLNTGGATTQNVNDDILAATGGLELIGTGPYTLTNSTNNVANLAGNSNAISYRDADAVTITTVGGTTGITTSNDNVSVQTGDTLTISSAISIGTGNLTLNTVGATTQTATITAQGLELLGAGAKTLNSANDVDNLAGNAGGAIAFTDSDGFDVTTVNTAGLSAGAALTLTATTGNISVVNTAAANDINAAGLITITLSANNALFTINTNADVETSTGGVTISADKMNLAGSITATAGTQIVTLQNSSGVDAIDLGSTTDANPNTLELSDGEIDRIAVSGTGTLRIGNTSMGAISITQPINPNIAGSTTILSLRSNSTVGQTGTGSITVASLAITANGAVSMSTNPNSVTTLSIDTNTGAVTFTDVSGIVVGTVDGVLGIDTDNGGVTLVAQSGDVTVSNTAALNDIDATAAILITLQGDNAVFTIDPTADVETTAGGITINADEMVLDGSITATSGSQTIRLRPFETGEQINLGSTGSAVDDVLELSDEELDRVTVATTGVIQIGRNDASASDNITFSDTISRATAITLHLFTGADIVDTNGSFNDVAGPAGISLAIDAATGIGSSSILETAVSNFAFNNTTSGRVELRNTGALTITSIDGIATSNNTGPNDTNLVTTGAFTFAVNTTSIGGLTGSAQEAGGVNTDNLTVNANVTVRSTAGGVTLRAGDRIILPATSTVLSDIGDIFLISGNSDTDNDGSQTLNGLIQANGTATSRVTINLLNETGSATQAASGTILASLLYLTSAVNGGSFSLATSTTNDVGTIGALSDGSIAYRDVNNLIIAQILGAGFRTTNDDVQLFTGGTLLIDDDVIIGTGDLGLNAGGEVTQNAGDTIAANGLALTNVGPFTLNDPGNSVATIAASTAATANNTINYVDVNSLIVGSVDVMGTVINGITTTGDDVRLTATTGGFTISNNINLNSGGAGGAGGDLELTATTGATQTAPILAAGLALRGTGASINTNRYILTNTSNNVASISGAMTRGHVVYIDVNDLNVDDVTVTTGAAAPITVTTTGISVGNDVGSVDVDPDAGGPGGGDIVLRAGITLANAILTAGSILTVTPGNPLSTTSGTGGDVLIGGGVELNAAINLGSGDVDLGGSAPDICIDTATVITLAPAGSTATLQPIGNIIVHESLSTVGGDLTLNADADNNGTGGIWVRDNGRIDADGALFLYGSELTAATCGTPAVPTVGIQIDNTSVAVEINANSSIVIETKTNAVAGGSNDDTVLDGNVHSEGGGPISIAAENRIVQNGTSTVGLASAGNIYYQANDIVIDTASAVINAQAGGIVHLRNRSAGLPINLGSTASTASGAVAATLSISNAELNRISTVSAVRIGFNSAFTSSPNTPNVLTTAGNAGTITVTAADINVLNSTVLHLITGTNIVDDGTGGVGTITETNLALEAVTGIDLDNVNAVPGVSGNDVDNLAIRLTGAAAANDAAFKDVDDLNFAVVDTVATPAAVNVVGDLTIIAGGAVTQSAAIITGGLELIDLFNDPNPPLTFLAFPNYYLPNSSNQIGRLEAYSQRSVNITNSIAIAVDVVANNFRTFPASGASGIWVQSLQLTAPTVIVNSPIETNDELGFVTFDVTTLLDINANIFSRGKIEQIGTGVVTVDDVQLRTTDDNITFLGGVTLDGPSLTTPTVMSTDAGWTTPFTGIQLAADAAAQTGAGSVIFNSTLRSNPSGDTAAAYRGNDLTLETGTGNIQFIGQVGGASGAAGRLGVVNIVDAHDVTASTGFSANAFYQQAGDGETRFNGFVQTNGRRDVLTPTVATNFGVDITTKMITLNAALQTTSAPGSGAAAAIRLNNSGTLSIVAGAGSINSDGAVSQAGTGNNLVGGDIVTTNDNISFLSDTYLSGSPLQINSGNADVSFAARFQINNKTVTIRDKDFVDLGTVTAIAGGLLNVFVANTATRGSIQAGSGETITGAGTINADVNVLTGGTLAPAMDASGLGTGILTINGNVVLGTNAVYAVDLNGTSAGASYDQVVTGATFTFTVTGAILSATRPVTFNPATGAVLKIIDGSVNVVGDFSNAANGTYVYINGLYFRADYDVTAGDLTLTRQDPPGAAVTIIDDNGSSPSTPVTGFTLSPNTTAAWSPNSVAGRGYGNDLRFAAAGNGSTTALYTFTGLIPGHTYRVSTTWFPHINRATDSPFTVDDGAGGTAAVTTTINQRNNPDDFTSGGSAWEDLVVGGYTITGTTLTVLLTNNTSTGYVIADAVRIEDITGAAPEIVVMDGTTDIPDGTGVVDFGTTSTLGADVSKVISIKNTGLSPLVLSSATITAPPGFTITGYTPQTIAPGATGTPFTITLSHLVAGNYSGQISFNTNDFDENPFNFTVKGGVTSGLTQIADNLAQGGGYNTITGSANNAGTNLMYGEVGPWHNNDDSLVGYQQDLRYAQANTNAQATWTFSGLAAGTYRVSVTYRAEPNRASNASYTVTGTGVVNPTTISINQRVAPNQFQDANVYWIDLDGAFGTVSAGGTITVTLDALGSNGFVIADAVRIEFLHPLQAEDGPAANPTATVLTTADLDATAAAAVARWQQAGLTTAQQIALNGLVFAVANLPDAYVGGETEGTIFVDSNAAGYGWFVDSTPADDAEFGLTIASTEFQATDPLAAGHMDLLTVLMHEIGHRLGLDDVSMAAGDHGLMTESLDIGTRRLPTGISVSEGKIGVEDVSSNSSDAVTDDVQDEVFVNLGATETSAPTTTVPTIAVGGSSGGSSGNHHGSGHATGGTLAGYRHHRTGGKPHNDANESRSLLGTLFNLVRKRR